MQRFRDALREARGDGRLVQHDINTWQGPCFVCEDTSIFTDDEIREVLTEFPEVTYKPEKNFICAQFKSLWYSIMPPLSYMSEKDADDVVAKSDDEFLAFILTQNYHYVIGSIFDHESLTPSKAEIVEKYNGFQGLEYFIENTHGKLLRRAYDWVSTHPAAVGKDALTKYRGAHAFLIMMDPRFLGNLVDHKAQEYVNDHKIPGIEITPEARMFLELA